jgi:hypothetical protein
MSAPRISTKLPPFRRQLAGGLLATTLVLTVPVAVGASSASATTSNIRTTVSSLQAAGQSAVGAVAPKCEQGITGRQTQIDKLDNQLAASVTIHADHKSTLTSDLSSSAGGLSALNGQIQSATTLKALLPLCEQIVTGYRIYVLQTPRVHLTMGADTETAVITKLQAIGPKLQSAISAAQAKGEDVGQAPTLYADFTTKLADASSKSSGAADQVLPLTVAEYNAGTAKPVLQTTYQNLVLARGDLIAARQDATQIVQILQGLH